MATMDTTVKGMVAMEVMTTLATTTIMDMGTIAVSTELLSLLSYLDSQNAKKNPHLSEACPVPSI